MKIRSMHIKDDNIVAAGSIIILMALAYGVVTPAIISQRYLSELDRDLLGVKASLNKVAASANLPVFTNPDVSLPERQVQLQSAIDAVQEARTMLDNFDSSIQLFDLPGPSFTKSYREAKVREARSLRIGQQSRQVLEDYAGLLQYLSAYTALQAKLDGHLAQANTIKNFDALAGRGRTMAAIASAIKNDEQALQELTPPANFTALQAEAMATFQRTATGFNKLAYGLNRAIDSQIYAAARDLEVASYKNQVNDKDALVALADSAPNLRQLVELPEKVEYAQEEV
ncbi:MAG TPA: hypothetical protein VIS56_00390 [Candidatus Saccharimonadales bacterium]